MATSQQALRQAAQKEVVNLLEGLSVEDILSSSDKKQVLVLHPSQTIEEALNFLSEHRILSAPIQDPERTQYLGFIDVLDILSYILKVITDDEVNPFPTWYSYTNDITELKAKDEQLGSKTIGAAIDLSQCDPFIPLTKHGNLYQLVEGVFYKGTHRAPVFDDSTKFDTMIGLISQSDVAKSLAEQITELPTFANASVAALELGTRNVITMSKDALAIHAFFLMYFNKVSAVAIVDEEQKLLANLSASDLRGLMKHGGTASLLKPVLAYLMETQEFHRHPMTCKLGSRLETIVLRLGLFRLHRLWIVDDDERPIGLVSLTDIMKFIAE